MDKRCSVSEIRVWTYSVCLDVLPSLRVKPNAVTTSSPRCKISIVSIALIDISLELAASHDRENLHVAEGCQQLLDRLAGVLSEPGEGGGDGRCIHSRSGLVGWAALALVAVVIELLKPSVVGVPTSSEATETYELGLRKMPTSSDFVLGKKKLSL